MQEKATKIEMQLPQRTHSPQYCLTIVLLALSDYCFWAPYKNSATTTTTTTAA